MLRWWLAAQMKNNNVVRIFVIIVSGWIKQLIKNVYDDGNMTRSNWVPSTNCSHFNSPKKRESWGNCSSGGPEQTAHRYSMNDISVNLRLPQWRSIVAILSPHGCRKVQPVQQKLTSRLPLNGFRSLTVNWSRCGFEEASEPTVSLERPLGILQINGTVGQYTIWEREREGISFWWGQHSHIENNCDKSGRRDVWWAAHRGAADVTETTVLSKQSPERNARETLYLIWSL